MKPRILLDVDDVLGDFKGYYVKVANRLSGENYKVEQITGWNIDEHPPLPIKESPEHIFDMYKTKNVIARAPVHGDPRTLGRRKHAHDFVQARFNGKCVHVRTRDHDFSDLHLTEFYGANDEFFLAGRKQPTFARLLDLNLQLFSQIGRASWRERV